MTAAWRSREELVHQLVTLARQGLSRRALARALGVSRNTVRVILATHGEKREIEHVAIVRLTRVPRGFKADAHRARINELIARYATITAQRVFETLREEGFDGSYTSIKRMVRRLRPPPRPTPSLTTPIWSPGEMAECDWSPYDVTFIDGHAERVQAYSYVLALSTRKFVDLYRQSDFFALIDGHVHAFDRFRGCARTCKYDGQKAVVLRWEGQQPIFNPRFLAFAAHYEFRPVAVRDPNHKPRVERGFWEVERSFFNGRSFSDFDDLRAQLARWLDTVVDTRLRRGKSALDRFAIEQPALVPLPRHPYDTARVVYRVCSIDGFVDWEGNHYAVPYDHVTDILPVRITQKELFVYAADLRVVARHELGARGAGEHVDPTGIHPPPRRRSAIDFDQLRLVFDRMGERAAEFFRLLAAGPPRIWGHQARQILLLRARFDTADLDDALGHAAAFGALDAHAVERVLVARATPRPLDEYVAEETVRRVTESLGHARTVPRDLTEYDRLPGAAASPASPDPCVPDAPDAPHATSAPKKETSPCPSDPAPQQSPSDPSTTTTSSSTDSDDTSRSSG